MLIVNNKGQTPYSLGHSHLLEETMAAIEEQERVQLLKGVEWENYYASHADGRDYGDLDPRFIQRNHNVFNLSPVRMKLIPCCKMKDLSSVCQRNCSQCIDGGSRLHQLVIFHEDRVGVIDTIRLTKSLKFTTRQSRADKVANSQSHSKNSSAQSIKKKLAKKHSTPYHSFCHKFLDNLSFSGTISNMQRSRNNILARLIPYSESIVDCKEPLKDRGLYFLPSTSSTTSEHNAAVVYVSFDPTKIKIFSSETQQHSIDVKDLVNCVVRVTGSCERPIRLDKFRSKKSDGKDYEIWRFDVNVNTVTNFSGPTLTVLSEPSRQVTDLSIDNHVISKEYYLVGDHARLFHSYYRQTCSDHRIFHDNRIQHTGGGKECERQLCIDDVLYYRSSMDCMSHDKTSTTVIVDSMITLLQFKEFIGLQCMAGKQVFGFDCEWKPTNRISAIQKPRVSLLQVCTRRNAFLIDLQILISNATSDEAEVELNSILLELFHHSNVLVIGYSIKQDLDYLSSSFPQMTCFNFRDVSISQDRISNIVDMQPCLSYIIATSQIYNSNGEGRIENLRGQKWKGNMCSLARACEAVLDRSLSKKMQRSNWNMRPMTPAQIEYAAMDVFVLLLLFDAVLCNLDMFQ